MFENYVLPLFALLIILQFVTHRKNRMSLPPGPVGYPIIGNVFDMPKSYDPLVWAKLRDLYGPIASFSAIGTSIIILNDIEIAKDILDKKSLFYSDRPSSTFLMEMVGWSRASAFYQYHDDRFRLGRKLKSQVIGSKKSVANFHSLLESEAYHFLLCVCEDPDKLKHHIKAWAVTTILRLVYGYNVNRNGNDPLMKDMERANYEFDIASKPGAWLVDIVPFLRYLPSWLPGMGFKKLAQKYRRTLDLIAELPYHFTKAQMASGTAPESFISRLLDVSSDGKNEELIKWTAVSIYAGGADTTVALLYAFYLAMMLFPDVQRAAQKEIDTVVGVDRLPSLADREQLPYVSAVQKELLRWSTAAPLGIAHVASEDSMYNGYRIPKGAVIMPNIWLFHHDPLNFENPDRFRPERYLGDLPHKFDPYDTAFGFGRRICPGKELADASLFSAIVGSLAVFEIKRAAGEEHRDITSYLEWKKDLVSHPVPFRCQIQPRSLKAELLIDSIPEIYPLPPNDAETLSAIRLSG